MPSIEVSLEVSYSQISLFCSGVENPFNDWEERHVSQGFSWRRGSVSFRTLKEGGTHDIEIIVVDKIGSISPDAVRVIEVPFDVQGDGSVEIASIGDGKSLILPVGEFLLRCEMFDSSREPFIVRMTLSTGDDPKFKISVADSELSTDEPLLMTANAAA